MKSLPLVAFGLFVIAASRVAVCTTIDEDIAFMYNQVRQRQWNDSKPVGWLPEPFGHEIGKFQTNVHFNFVGGPVEQQLRALPIPDDNMFVTSFVLESIFEALDFAGDVVEPDQWSVAAAVNATLGLRDKNRPEGVPIFGFWPQQFMPAQDPALPKTWEQWPINLAGLSMETTTALEVLRPLIVAIVGEANWEKFGPPIINFFHGLTVMFQIPPDADDTGVVISLDRHIRNHATQFPDASAIWNAAQLDFSDAFKEYDRYSYCIASDVLDKNLIDPRTYFWAHEYLNNITDPNACIVTTWFQNTSTMMNIVMNKTSGPAMPINVNNLDPTVGANSLYAMSTSLLAGDSAWLSTNTTRQLYLQTADFVAYALRTQATQRRPDLELLYYPPVYNIMWFVARHVNMLRAHRATVGPLPFPEMDEVESKLAEAVASGGLDYILATVVEDCGVNSTDPVVCWNGFLGRADTDAAGNATPHYEDRFANTAVALLGLIDGFTVRMRLNGTAKHQDQWALQWLPEAPVAVKNLVSQGVAYLRAALHANGTGFQNAFFSGSGKYWEQYQFW